MGIAACEEVKPMAGEEALDLSGLPRGLRHSVQAALDFEAKLAELVKRSRNVVKWGPLSERERTQERADWLVERARDVERAAAQGVRQYQSGAKAEAVERSIDALIRALQPEADHTHLALHEHERAYAMRTCVVIVTEPRWAWIVERPNGGVGRARKRRCPIGDLVHSWQGPIFFGVGEEERDFDHWQLDPWPWGEKPACLMLGRPEVAHVVRKDEARAEEPVLLSRHINEETDDPLFAFQEQDLAHCGIDYDKITEDLLAAPLFAPVPPRVRKAVTDHFQKLEAGLLSRCLVGYNP